MAYKLTYFDFTGRAEAIRMAFHIGGIPFEDSRVSFADWPTVKATMRYKQVPVLEIDGKPLCQTNAILRLVGKLTDLYPTCCFVAAKVDEAIDVMEDFGAKYMSPIFGAMTTGNEEAKAAAVKRMVDEGFPALWNYGIARIAENGGDGWMFGSKLTIADLKFATFFEIFHSGWFGSVPSDVDAYPAAREFMRRVFAVPKVASWRIRHRPVKLTYFNFKGRAEPIRLAFRIGGIPFEDKRIAQPDWPAAKATMPYGQIPVLEYDGNVVCQSSAILRFAGKHAGLYPECPVAALKVDEIIDLIEDFITVSLGPTMRMADAEKKPAREAIAAGPLPKLLVYINTRIAANPAGWVAGSKLTVADLKVAGLADAIVTGNFDYVPATVLDAYPGITGVLAKVKAVPEVAKAWAPATA